MASKTKKLEKKIKQAIKKAISKKNLAGNGNLVKKAATKLSKKLLKPKDSEKKTNEKVSHELQPVVWNTTIEKSDEETKE